MKPLDLEWSEKHKVQIMCATLSGNIYAMKDLNKMAHR